MPAAYSAPYPATAVTLHSWEPEHRQWEAGLGTELQGGTLGAHEDLHSPHKVPHAQGRAALNSKLKNTMTRGQRDC